VKAYVGQDPFCERGRCLRDVAVVRIKLLPVILIQQRHSTLDNGTRQRGDFPHNKSNRSRASALIFDSWKRRRLGRTIHRSLWEIAESHDTEYRPHDSEYLERVLCYAVSRKSHCILAGFAR